MCVAVATPPLAANAGHPPAVAPHVLTLAPPAVAPPVLAVATASGPPAVPPAFAAAPALLMLLLFLL
jgi:hypothetical protein